jgi:hypothetical protein
MGLRAILVAAATLCASACPAQEDVPVDLPVSAEIVRTYRIEIYDLFRCFIGLTPELRNSASGWTMTYTDSLALIEAAGLAEIGFRPVGPRETEVVIAAVGNPYRLFHPGKWFATAAACARGPGDIQASSALPPWSAEPERAPRRRLPLRSRM